MPWKHQYATSMLGLRLAIGGHERVIRSRRRPIHVTLHKERYSDCRDPAAADTTGEQKMCTPLHVPVPTLSHLPPEPPPRPPSKSKAALNAKLYSGRFLSTPGSPASTGKRGVESGGRWGAPHTDGRQATAGVASCHRECRWPAKSQTSTGESDNLPRAAAARETRGGRAGATNVRGPGGGTEGLDGTGAVQQRSGSRGWVTGAHATARGWCIDGQRWPRSGGAAAAMGGGSSWGSARRTTVDAHGGS